MMILETLTVILTAMDVAPPPKAEEHHVEKTHEETSHADDHHGEKRASTASSRLGICIRKSQHKVERVTLGYDISEEGRVENIQVSDSTDHCFDETAKNSLKQWAYEPKMQDGVAIKQTGLSTSFEFKTGGSSKKKGGDKDKAKKDDHH